MAGILSGNWSPTYEAQKLCTPGKRELCARLVSWCQRDEKSCFQAAELPGLLTASEKAWQRLLAWDCGVALAVGGAVGSGVADPCTLGDEEFPPACCDTAVVPADGLPG